MIMDEMSHMGYSLKSPVILPHDPASPTVIYFPASLCQKPTLEMGSEKTPMEYTYLLFFDLITGTSEIPELCLLKGSECSQS